MADLWINTNLHAMVDAYFAGKTFKCMLLSADNVTQATDQYVSDVSQDELTDSSYSRQTLTGFTVELNEDSHAVKIDADNPVFSGLSDAETVAIAIIFEVGANDAISKMWWKLDGANIVTDGTDVTVVIDATDGIASIDT